MNWTIVGLVVLVVAVLAGPFLALKAVSVWKARRLPPALPKDERDEGGGW